MSHNVFKVKVKTKSTNEKSRYKPTIPYIGDYYLKDFQYISSERNKNGVRNCHKSTAGNSSCRLFAKLWLIEVMKGLKQFLYEGSLHGVKYIFEPSFKRKERLTWVIIVVVSIAFCAVNIVQLFSKWTSTPFVNVIDSLPTPLWVIPFPSVVICPHLHIKRSFVDVSRLKNLDRFFAGLVCPHIRSEDYKFERRMTESETKQLNEFLNKASPSCQEVVRACKWKPIHGRAWSTKDCCEKLFKPILTDYGLCLIFNSLPLHGPTNETLAWQRLINPNTKIQPVDWDLDKGFSKHISIDPDIRPWRVKGSGEANGLNLELFLNSSEHQVACEGNNVGFTIMIRSPAQHVYTTTVIRLPMNKMTSIEVSPTTHKTDNSLRILEPNVRQCLFQDERNLEHFFFYTEENCKMDILMKKAKDICKCAFYAWPRLNITDPICTTTEDYACINKMRDDLADQQVYTYYLDNDETLPQEKSHSSNFEHSCYPPCNEIIYNRQVFYSNKAFRTDNTTFDHISKKEITQINVHFHQDMLLGQHRHAQYDDYYFAGAIGGLLSLFLGFSIISVAELIYFVILKPIRITLELYLQNH